MRAFGCAVVLLAISWNGAAAQDSTRCAVRSNAALDTAKADVAIIARVQARVLRFNADPQTSLNVSGCPVVDTSRVVVKTNLPSPVRAGVVYQNVTVDFRLKLSFAEIDCVLASALASATADSTAIARARSCAAPTDTVRQRR